MFTRMVRGDLRRSRGTAIALFLLIATASALVAAGAGTVATVVGALDGLFARAKVPHAMQMHAGPLDEEAIHAWAAVQPEIADTQVLATYPLPTNGLIIGGNPQPDSVLEPAATAQSPRFDLLLGLDDSPLVATPGHVHLPLAYADQAAPGDAITLRLGAEERTLTVAGYLRDAQMNPTMVTSKRLLLHPDDVSWVASHVPPEYLVEFRLADSASPASVLGAYAAAGLPALGPAIDEGSIKLLAGLSASLVVALLAVVAAFVAAIGALTVRLAVRTAVAADLGQIGTMKAIGIPERTIRTTYLAKYLALAGGGALLGTAAAPLLHGPLTSQALLEMGGSAVDVPVVLAWVLGGTLVAGGAALYVNLLLCPLRRMPALAAMRSTTTTRLPLLASWRLTPSRLPVMGWLGARSASQRGQLGLAAVFALVAVMVLIPAAVVSTLNSPGLVRYFGIGDSDLHVGTHDPVAAQVLRNELGNDPRVARAAEFAEVRTQIATAEGWDQLPVMLGDHEAFPVEFSAGTVPAHAGEIALSARVAGEQDVTAGGAVRVRDAVGERTLTVSGVYQDISNGGRTAKAVWDEPGSGVAGWTFAVDVAGDASAAAEEWRGIAGVTAIETDQAGIQMMGPVLGALGILVWAAIGLAGGIALGLTFLFLRLVLAGEAAEWAALRGIGIPDTRLRRSFLVRYGALLCAGVALGALAAAGLGEFVVARAAGGLMGAPDLTLLGVPWTAALALLFVLALAVGAGVRAGSAGLANLTIPTITEE